MSTAVLNKPINWQIPPANGCEISVEDYRAMVANAENSGYMSYEAHRRKLNEWLNEISKERTAQDA